MPPVSRVRTGQVYGRLTLLILNGRLPSLKDARNRLDEIIAIFDSEKEQTYA